MIAIIEAIICQDKKISSNSLHYRTRERGIMEPRQVIMYLARTKTSLSFNQIGRYFNLHHSTVISAMKAIKNHIDTEPKFKQQISLYEKKVDCYKDDDLNNNLLAIEVLKIEIETLRGQLLEKEIKLLQLQNKLKINNDENENTFGSC